MLTANLDLGIIGNGSVAALIDKKGSIVWCCFPSFDGDPIFCALLTPRSGGGLWAFELENFERAEQFYRRGRRLGHPQVHRHAGSGLEMFLNERQRVMAGRRMGRPGGRVLRHAGLGTGALHGRQPGAAMDRGG